ncbi:MAG: ATP-binding protein, partial [Thermoanaerobaculia bacterium]|nr:ATP-binding protein [Thermoanaerobaculia bacterium]
VAETLFSGSAGGSLPEPLAPLAERIERIGELVEGLSQLARVGSGDAQRELCDAREAVSAALANLGSAIEETGARLTIRALPTVRAAPAQLAILFQNLIGNALAFRGGETPEIAISARQEDTDWVFTVRDNGIGFDPELGETLFEPFRKLDPTSAGSGIGLAICRRIVEAHGGRIWAESERGHGAAFHFTLPLLEAAREQA